MAGLLGGKHMASMCLRDSIVELSPVYWGRMRDLYVTKEHEVRSWVGADAYTMKVYMRVVCQQGT